MPETNYSEMSKDATENMWRKERKALMATIADLRRTATQELNDTGETAYLGHTIKRKTTRLRNVTSYWLSGPGCADMQVWTIPVALQRVEECAAWVLSAVMASPSYQVLQAQRRLVTLESLLGNATGRQVNS